MNFSSVTIERKRAKNGGYWGSVRDADDKCVLTVAAKGKGVVYTKDDIKELFEGLVSAIKDNRIEYREA